MDREPDGSLPFPSSGDEEPLLAHVMKPWPVIDRFATIAHREAELGRALLVSVIGDNFDGLEAHTQELIASQFDLTVDSLSLLHSRLASFVLVLLNEDTMTRVYNAKWPIIGQNFRLHAMPKSRFMQSSASSLTSASDIEL
jgi:hypothetical protein